MAPQAMIPFSAYQPTKLRALANNTSAAEGNQIYSSQQPPLAFVYNWHCLAGPAVVRPADYCHGILVPWLRSTLPHAL